MNKKLERAIGFYQQGKFKKALEQVKTLNKKKNSRSFTSLQLEAVCLAKEGKFRVAKHAIEEAIALSSNSTEQQQAQNILTQVNAALDREAEKAELSTKHLSDVISEMSIQAEDEHVKVVIEELNNYLISKGAKFDKHLVFSERAGELSITSQASQRQVHMQVPLNCMPLLCDYRYSIDADGHLQAKPQNKMLNPDAAPVMSIMNKLFKLTGKLKGWRESSPFVVYQQYPAILEKIFNFRPQGQKLAGLYAHFQKGDWDQLLIDSFLGSREFTYQQAHLTAAKIHSENSTEKGLLAIIDFLNHRVKNGEYFVNTQSSMMEIIGTADLNSKELFVQYGKFDGLLCYLLYGFVDQQSTFCFSGKCEVKLL